MRFDRFRAVLENVEDVGRIDIYADHEASSFKLHYRQAAQEQTAEHDDGQRPVPDPALRRQRDHAI